MSKIQWTGETLNPIHLVKPDGSHGGHWCRKKSPGCLNCYSEKLNQSNFYKFASHLKYVGEAPDNLIFDLPVMETVFSKKDPETYFLCSMTDIAGEWVKEEWLDQMFAVMAIAREHTFQVLTKWPERLLPYLSDPQTPDRIDEIIGNYSAEKGWCVQLEDWPIKNVWIGVSVENQNAADSRIPPLLQTPAKVRFLSCEPLLEAVDLRRSLPVKEYSGIPTTEKVLFPGVDWVIIGAESGLKARECQIAWIRSVSRQCQTAGVSVFVKQLGSNPVNELGQKIKLKDRKGSDVSEFPDDLKIRDFPGR